MSSPEKKHTTGDLVFAIFLTVMTTVAALSIIFGAQVDNHNERWVNWDNCLESGAEESFCNDTFKAPEGAR